MKQLPKNNNYLQQRFEASGDLVVKSTSAFARKEYKTEN